MSKKATFVAGKTAMRGGIPVCWPAFNDRNLAAGKHGIVRTSDQWVVEATGRDPPRDDPELQQACDDPYVVLAHPTVYFDVDAATKAIAGFSFDRPSDGVAAVVPVKLSLKLKLLPSALRVEMAVRNDGNVDFGFSTVLHTYFSVNEMPVTVHGFQGLSGLLNGAPFTDHDATVVVGGDTETQRLYTHVQSAVSWETQALPSADGKASTKRLTITKSSTLPDVVLWNVGSQHAQGMADLEAGGDQRYLCVESGVCASDDAIVPAGQTWVGWQEVEVSELP
jgi:glucose-6-phosphate 1-epimerase